MSANTERQRRQCLTEYLPMRVRAFKCSHMASGEGCTTPDKSENSRGALMTLVMCVTKKTISLEIKPSNASIVNMECPKWCTLLLLTIRREGACNSRDRVQMSQWWHHHCARCTVGQKEGPRAQWCGCMCSWATTSEANGRARPDRYRH